MHTVNMGAPTEAIQTRRANTDVVAFRAGASAWRTCASQQAATRASALRTRTAPRSTVCAGTRTTSARCCRPRPSRPRACGTCAAQAARCTSSSATSAAGAARGKAPHLRRLLGERAQRAFYRLRRYACARGCRAWACRSSISCVTCEGLMQLACTPGRPRRSTSRSLWAAAPGWPRAARARARCGCTAAPPAAWSAAATSASTRPPRLPGRGAAAPWLPPRRALSSCLRPSSLRDGCVPPWHGHARSPHSTLVHTVPRLLLAQPGLTQCMCGELYQRAWRKQCGRVRQKLTYAW